jgi:hypothetical protein
MMRFLVEISAGVTLVLYSYIQISVIKSRREDKLSGACRTFEARNAYKNIILKPEGNLRLGSRSHTRKDNIEMDFKETGHESVD